MKIRVRSFASLADITGAELTIELADSATIAHAIEALVVQFPDLEPRIEGTRFAKNAAFSNLDSGLSDGDELALIPPVSGG